MPKGKPPSRQRPRKGLELDDDTRALLGGRTEQPKAAEAREAGVRAERRRERHDAGSYTPRGWKLEGARLRQQGEQPVQATLEDVRLLHRVRGLLDLVLTGEVRTQPLTEADAARVWIDAPLLDAFRRFYRDAHGIDFGQEWRFVLVSQLRRCVRIREQRRLGKETGEDIPSAAEILATVRDATPASTPPPAWLDAKKIEALIPTINLGGKGGRGKTGRTPEGAVRWLVEQHEPPARPSRASGRAKAERTDAPSPIDSTQAVDMDDLLRTFAQRPGGNSRR